MPNLKSYVTLVFAPTKKKIPSTTKQQLKTSTLHIFFLVVGIKNVHKGVLVTITHANYVLASRTT